MSGEVIFEKDDKYSISVVVIIDDKTNNETDYFTIIRDKETFDIVECIHNIGLVSREKVVEMANNYIKIKQSNIMTWIKR